MHCSRATLAAYLEGDLGLLRNWRVAAHLKRCLPCSRSLLAAEHELQELSPERPIPEWHAPAFQSRLHTGLQSVESELNVGRDFPRHLTATTACGLAALAVAVLLWRSPHASVPPPPAAPEVIARASAAENELLRAGAIRQDLTVEIEQIRPKPDKRRSRLEAWSDNQTGRFAARWTNEDGTLKQAQWKPSDGSEIVYAPARSPLTIRRAGHDRSPTSLASIAESAPDLSQVEATFMRWMESRSWRPISFAADLSVWTHRDGTVLRVEQIQSEQGTPRLRITAQRRSSRMTAVLTLEVDAQTYSPRLQTVRIEEENRAVEFRLALAGTRRILSSELNETLFRPPLSVQPPPSRLALSAPPLPGPQPPAASLADLEDASHAFSARVRVLYALHRSGACTGHPVEIAETPQGIAVRSRGSAHEPVAESLLVQAPLQEVLSALADLRTAPASEAEHTGLMEMQRHLRALEEAIDLIGSAGIVKPDVSSQKLLRRMAEEHDRYVRSHVALLRDEGNLSEALRQRSVSLLQRYSELSRKLLAFSESRP